MYESPLPTSDDNDQGPTQLDDILAVKLELEITNERLQQYNDISKVFSSCKQTHSFFTLITSYLSGQ